jgi:hypothetical protein
MRGVPAHAAAIFIKLASFVDLTGACPAERQCAIGKAGDGQK